MLAIAPLPAPPASIPSPSRNAWHLGPFSLRAYALCILAGVFIAVWWTSRPNRARGGSGARRAVPLPRAGFAPRTRG